MSDIKFVKYCRNCMKPMYVSTSELTDTDDDEFCCDSCKEEHYKIHGYPGNRCDRCGAVVDELTEYKNVDKTIQLCSKCSDKFDSMLEDMTNEFTGLDNFEMAAKHIIMGLHDMGFETDEANFKDTPKRFARAYCEIFSGCKDTQDQIDAILATSFPSQGSENMVIAKDIVVFSMCPHHLLPVEYHVCVGYIPKKGGNVLGISKLARLVRVLAKRPALQETFTQEIVDHLTDDINSAGAIALVEGQHCCMRMRGSKAVTASITTTSVSGYFKENQSTKQEFMDAIKDRKKFSC